MVFRRTDRPGDVDTNGLSGYQLATQNHWYIYRNHPDLRDAIAEQVVNMGRIAELDKSDHEEALRQLREIIPGIHPTASIVFPITIEYPKQIEVGEGTFINGNFETCSSGLVKIGKNSFIGPHCKIYTPNHHPFDIKLRRDGWQYDTPVTIGDDVWFGGSVVVCPGVTIGSNVVVGAGAVVTKDVPDNTMVGGNPAKFIKNLLPHDKLDSEGQF
jgi:maltose O-acetyltransferase